MANTKMDITVLGAGAWGTALAVSFAKKGLSVGLWGHDPDHVARLSKERMNHSFLPEVHFPETLHPISDLKSALNTDTLLLAIPSHAFESVLKACQPHWKPGRIAIATKGLSSESGWLSDVVTKIWPDCPTAVLLGPSFAKETAIGCPTAVAFASNNEEWAIDGQQLMSGETLRLYRTTDLIGAQLGSVAKNVLAISVGIADGLQLGANARAALITRGLAELMRLGRALGAQPETLMGLSGLGDLVLTATDNQSRNRRFGLLIGKGKTPKDACSEIGHVVEGMNNAQKLSELAAQNSIDAPIITVVNEVLQGTQTPEEALQTLLSRPMKAES